MTAASAPICDHCYLPLGLRPMQRAVNGESRTFCCYGCCIAYLVKNGSGEEWEAAWLLIRLGVGGFLSMNIMMLSLLLYSDSFTGPDAEIVPWIHLLLWSLATPALAILGEPFLRDAWYHARRGHLTSSVLILIGVGAAYAYSTVATLEGGTRVYFDTAAMVLMLFTLGRYLEAAGRARAARDLSPLLAAEGEWATIVEGETQQRCLARDIAAGALVRVRPGERIPVDGVIVEGESHTDEAVVTGESRQMAKGAGATAIAGSMNLDGLLLIRCTNAGATTRWAQICRSVRSALSQRTPTQRIADRILGILVPVMVALAGATVVFWLTRLPFDQAMLNGLAVLVVACPCAVGLAAPLATSLGIARLARHGCVVRSPAALEALARLRLVAFDKTGTLTAGQAHLIAIETDGADPDDALARAAGLDLHSDHDLARAIVAAAVARDIAPAAVGAVRAIPGRGIRGIAEGEAIAAGNRALMSELGWPTSSALTAHALLQEQSGLSVVHVGWCDRVRAVLTLDDTALPEARATIEALRGRGLRAALLTGDHDGAARRIAETVGLGDWQAGLSPENKQSALDRRRGEYGPVAMVGDGLNDGPVLAGADVGIAVASATDLARETADLVLPPNGLWLLPWIVDLSRAVHGTILTNLLWALGYNLVGIALAAAGLLQPILAAAIMAGSSILVIVNSLRLERFPEPDRAGNEALPKRQLAMPSFNAAPADSAFPANARRVLPDA